MGMREESRPEPDEDQELEPDSRFPSGPWTGFFLQPMLPGRHWMELNLTFRRGILRGDGRDRIGTFFFRGRYEVETGKCWWTKQYLGKHSLHYQGYNEGKGVWGIWEEPKASYWRGGFHIWPVAMGDPTGSHLSEALEEPITVAPLVPEFAEVAVP